MTESDWESELVRKRSDLERLQQSARRSSRHDSTNRRALGDIHRALGLLKRESTHQLELEFESQRTFEFLASQITTLRSALIQLSDVVIRENEASKADLQLRTREMESTLETQTRSVGGLVRELSLLKLELKSQREFLENRTSQLAKSVKTFRTSFASKLQLHSSAQAENVLRTLQTHSDSVQTDMESLATKHEQLDSEVRRLSQQIETSSAETQGFLSSVSDDFERLNSAVLKAHSFARHEEEREQELADKVRLLSVAFERQSQERSEWRGQMEARMQGVERRVREVEEKQGVYRREVDQIKSNVQRKFRSLANAMNFLLDVKKQEESASLSGMS